MDPEQEAAEFILREPADRVEELVELLTDGLLSPSMTRVRVQQRIRLGRGSLDRTMKLLSQWDGAEDAAGRLARTLLSQLRVAEDIQGRGVRAELVWTGTKAPGSPLRSTVPVVNEMLDAAESTVVVLAYSIWLGQAKAGSVLARFVDAASGERR